MTQFCLEHPWMAFTLGIAALICGYDIGMALARRCK